MLTVQGYGHTPGGKTALALKSLRAWQDAATDRPDGWLCAVVAAAFRKLVLLRLENTPAAELIADTAEIWVETLSFGMTEKLDRERFEKAFAELQGKIRKWPQPMELKKLLPSRTSRKTSEAAALPETATATHELGTQTFDAILEALK